MYNSKTVSLKQILWKVMNHPLAAQLSYNQAAEFAIEAIELIGAPLGYVNKVSKPLVGITNYKGGLPIDFVQVRGVRKIQDEDNYDNNAIPLTLATDLYFASDNCEVKEDDCNIKEYSYEIRNGVIFTTFSEGKVEVSYNALPTDDDGYPLIPDNPKFKLAVEYYILSRFLAPLFDIGKITDKAFNRIEQQCNWYVGAAQSSMQLGGIDHLQVTMNAINRLIISDQVQKNFYKFFGQQERIRRY